MVLTLISNAICSRLKIIVYALSKEMFNTVTPGNWFNYILLWNQYAEVFIPHSWLIGGILVDQFKFFVITIFQVVSDLDDYLDWKK